MTALILKLPSVYCSPTQLLAHYLTLDITLFIDNMMNKCGGCNLFAGKEDSRCHGRCWKFFHLGRVTYLFGSVAGVDANSFVCGVCLKGQSSLRPRLVVPTIEVEKESLSSSCPPAQMNVIQDGASAVSDLTRVPSDVQRVLATLGDITRQLSDLQGIKQKVAVLDSINAQAGHLADVVNNMSIRLDKLSDDYRSLSEKCTTLELQHMVLEERIDHLENDVTTLAQTANACCAGKYRVKVGHRTAFFTRRSTNLWTSIGHEYVSVRRRFEHCFCYRCHAWNAWNF